MPRYHTAPDKTFRRSLPSDPTAEVWGPGELDAWAETRVLSRSQRMEVDPVSQKGLIIVDSAMMEYEIVHAFLEHRDAGWNLYDAAGQPYERERETIDRIFSGQTGRRDRQYLAQEMVKAFFPEMAGVMTDAGESETVVGIAPDGSPRTSAEGNATLAPAPSRGPIVSDPRPADPDAIMAEARALALMPEEAQTPVLSEVERVG